MHALRIVAAIAVLALWAPRAECQDSGPPPDDFARTGAYIGLGGSVGLPNFEAQARYMNSATGFTTANVALDYDAELGLDFRLGYRMHPRFSLEGQFEYFPEFSASFTTGGISGKTDLEMWSTTINGKIFILEKRYQPFLLIGGGIWYGDIKAGSISTSDLLMAGRLGGGIDIYATRNIVLSFDAVYVMPAGDLETRLPTMTVGLQSFAGSASGNFAYASFGWGIQYRF